MTPSFRPGLELSRRFFEEAVRPVLEEAFPRLTYTAARIGGGSEVLGFDTERSADHEWGPRLQLFLAPQDADRLATSVADVLAERLPPTFLGWSTSFGPEEAAIRRMEPADGPVRHRVEVTSVAAWCGLRLGFDATTDVGLFDWLATSGQRLAEAVGGAVFTDPSGELTAMRRRLAWYPPDVWRYVLACQWVRLAQEEAFPGRCAEVGDELGCRVETARLVRDLMRLCLLMEQRYVPYGKWLGSAFALLPPPDGLGRDLDGALAAPTWPEREDHLASSYRAVAAAHNRLGLTSPLDTATRPYFDRPYQVLDAGRFATALLATIGDERLRGLPPVGNVDQFVDSTEVLSDPPRARVVAEALLGGLR